MSQLDLTFLIFQRYCDTRDLHSFPTRRSSDLVVQRMVANGASIDDKQVPVITEYLAKNFGPKNADAAAQGGGVGVFGAEVFGDRKSTRLNSSHLGISYAVFCLKKKKNQLSLQQ